jgi:hypothetical protein
MQVSAKLAKLGFVVTGRVASENRQKFVSPGIVPLYHDAFSDDVNRALKKARHFTLDCNWDRQCDANYMQIEALSTEAKSLIEDEADAKMYQTDLYAWGLPLQLNIGHIKGADWEDAQSNIVQHSMAQDMTEIPVSFSIEDLVIAQTKLNSINDLPDWVENNVHKADEALLKHLRKTMHK